MSRRWICLILSACLLLENSFGMKLVKREAEEVEGTDAPVSEVADGENQDEKPEDPASADTEPEVLLNLDPEDEKNAEPEDDNADDEAESESEGDKPNEESNNEKSEELEDDEKSEEPIDEKSEEPNDEKSEEPNDEKIDEPEDDEANKESNDEKSEEPEDEKSEEPEDEKSEESEDEKIEEPEDEKSEESQDEKIEEPEDEKSEEPDDDEGYKSGVNAPEPQPTELPANEDSSQASSEKPPQELVPPCQDRACNAPKDQRPFPFEGGFIFDSPFFSFEQVANYFHRLERAMEKIFAQAMAQYGGGHNAYENTTDQIVVIDGRPYRVHTSVTRGGNDQNSVLIEAVSVVPAYRRHKRSIFK